MRPGTMTRYTFLSTLALGNAMEHADSPWDDGDGALRRGYYVASYTNSDRFDKYVRFAHHVIDQKDEVPFINDGEVAQAIRDIFNAPDKTEAERMLDRWVDRYQHKAPKLAEWAQENIPQGLTVFSLPQPHRLRMRTTNGLERLNREIKRRTRVASIFPHEASLLRLASALLVEIDEEWRTGKIYLNMKSDHP